MSFSFRADDTELTEEIENHTGNILFFTAAGNNLRAETLDDIGLSATLMKQFMYGFMPVQLRQEIIQPPRPPREG